MTEKDFLKTPKKRTSRFEILAEYNKYGIKFSTSDRSVKMKNYLNGLAKTENMPYAIFQQDFNWYIKIRNSTYGFTSSLYLF